MAQQLEAVHAKSTYASERGAATRTQSLYPVRVFGQVAATRDEIVAGKFVADWDTLPRGGAWPRRLTLPSAKHALLSAKELVPGSAAARAVTPQRRATQKAFALSAARLEKRRVRHNNDVSRLGAMVTVPSHAWTFLHGTGARRDGSAAQTPAAWKHSLRVGSRVQLSSNGDVPVHPGVVIRDEGDGMLAVLPDDSSTAVFSASKERLWPRRCAIRAPQGSTTCLLDAVECALPHVSEDGVRVPS